MSARYVGFDFFSCGREVAGKEHGYCNVGAESLRATSIVSSNNTLVLAILGRIWFRCSIYAGRSALNRVTADITNRDAQKEVQNIALDSNFAIPGDPGFPLNQVISIVPSSSFVAQTSLKLPLPY